MAQWSYPNGAPSSYPSMMKPLKVKLLAPEEVGQTDYCEAISQVARWAQAKLDFYPNSIFSTMEFVFPVANAILYSFMGPRFQKDLLRQVSINPKCWLTDQSYHLLEPQGIWKPLKDSLEDSKINVRLISLFLFILELNYLLILFRSISDFNSVYFNNGS